MTDLFYSLSFLYILDASPLCTFQIFSQSMIFLWILLFVFWRVQVLVFMKLLYWFFLIVLLCLILKFWPKPRSEFACVYSVVYLSSLFTSVKILRVLSAFLFFILLKSYNPRNRSTKISRKELSTIVMKIFILWWEVIRVCLRGERNDSIERENAWRKAGESLSSPRDIERR